MCWDKIEHLIKWINKVRFRRSRKNEQIRRLKGKLTAVESLSPFILCVHLTFAYRCTCAYVFVHVDMYLSLWVSNIHQRAYTVQSVHFFYIDMEEKKEPGRKELETSSSTVQYFEGVFTNFLLYFNKTGNLGAVPQCTSDVLALCLRQHCYPEFILMWQELGVPLKNSLKNVQEMKKKCKKKKKAQSSNKLSVCFRW